jgi:phosphohistidine phosphatase
LQTASLVGNEIGFEGKLHREDALRPEGTFNQFAEMMEKYRNHEAIMIVGHNPNEASFLARTISPSGKARIDFKKGAIAKVVAESQGAQLHWMLTPKVARTLYEVSAESARPKTKRK